jgi:hypothetical protein
MTDLVGDYVAVLAHRQCPFMPSAVDRIQFRPHGAGFMTAS